MQNKKKPATPKDDQLAQANYNTIKLLPLQLVAGGLVLASSAVFIAIAGALVKLLGGAL